MQNMRAQAERFGTEIITAKVTGVDFADPRRSDAVAI
jgi:hypothetical protein